MCVARGEGVLKRDSSKSKKKKNSGFGFKKKRGSPSASRGPNSRYIGLTDKGGQGSPIGVNDKKKN